MFEQRLHRQFELTAHWGVRMLYEKNPRLISLAWKIELIITNLIEADCDIDINKKELKSKMERKSSSIMITTSLCSPGHNA